MEEKCLWGIIDELRDDVNCHIDTITDLQAENEIYRKSRDKRINMVKELKAEVERYKFHAETRANELVKRGAKLKELQAENDRLVEQVDSNSSSSSSTHTHTIGSVRCSIAREIAEYMENNKGCGGARLFLIPRDEFINDEYDHTIYWDDGME